MKLLLDQGLPRSAARLLREAGIDTVHVGEIGCSTADDAVILERGRDEDRIVVTLDADFHALLALSRATTPSVIRIRAEGLYGQKAADLIRAVLLCCAEDVKEGAVVTVQPGRIRIRRLPLLAWDSARDKP
jgi:predicted nuclease of predicted toxin-antitoxin system